MRFYLELSSSTVSMNIDIIYLRSVCCKPWSKGPIPKRANASAAGGKNVVTDATPSSFATCLFHVSRLRALSDSRLVEQCCIGCCYRSVRDD